MDCGISTACFYPEDTAASLAMLCAAGVKTTEVFLNTFRELEPPYVERLRASAAASGTRIAALHPFTSMLENFFFASEYEGRVEDGLRLYRRYFEVCRALEIPRVVFHGDHAQTRYPFEKYCRNYLLLRRTAREYGVDFCQENVVRCRCGQPEYIRRLREFARDDVSFVLDVKQQRRAGVPLAQMLDAMQGRIVHVHLSDAAPENDCVAPGAGQADLRPLFGYLRRESFAGTIIIELYRGGFSTLQELLRAAGWIQEQYEAAGGAPAQRREEQP